MLSENEAPCILAQFIKGYSCDGNGAGRACDFTPTSVATLCILQLLLVLICHISDVIPIVIILKEILFDCDRALISYVLDYNQNSDLLFCLDFNLNCEISAEHYFSDNL